ncbi:tetratricopeptide repeat protein [Methanosarcina sp. KYL-1]|uniref:tetratricopeptide repeat protein n=1 Tax=Methanosarcina sp. KYL-1 TaxID=2602068 RepID=UPI002100DB51|nr:tetratricopeptide repeat protein [Methanosarcina sp. KYL-1]MCQ1537065.1 tetratricopeptide repeat protein [Methanosarcina sp. KYL-1]
MVISPTSSLIYRGERLFVNRTEFIEVFENSLNIIGKKNYNVLVYHGIAGIGKTSLLKELAKRIDIHNQLYQNPITLWAFVDLRIESHRRVDKFLEFLRNQLQEKYDIKFNSFDIANAVYWKKINPNIPLQKESYSKNSIVEKLIDVFGGFVQINSRSIKKTIEEYPDCSDEWFLRRNKEILKLFDMNIAQLEKLLPIYWAFDLIDYLQKNSKSAVFFIDTYENLWENQRSLVNIHSKDEWIRELITNLPENCLWVIFGRRPLFWEEVDPDWEKYLEQYPLEKLPDKDVINFLNSCGVREKEIQQTLLTKSEGVPHYLALTVDSYSKIKKKRQPNPSDFAQMPEEINNSFLKYLTHIEIKTFKVLSTPRFWDYDIFKLLVTNFSTGYPIHEYLELHRFSFLHDTEGRMYMHQLMRNSLQEYQEEKLKKEVHLFMLEYYSNQLKDIDIKEITTKHETSLIEGFYHAKTALDVDRFFKWFIDFSDPFFRAAFWTLIISLYQEMLEYLEEKNECKKPEYGKTLDALATLYANVGKYEESLKMYEKKLTNNEEELGLEHPEVATTLNNLARLHESMGEYEKALKHYKQATKIREKVLGPEHPDVATTLNNLAGLYESMGEYEKALQLYQEAQKIVEKVLGPEHPDVAITLNNLAGLYESMGEYEKALQLYQEAQKIVEKVLGPEHPDVAKILNNLAGLYESMGEYEKALPSCLQALKIREKVLGPEHPDVAKILNNLAGLYNQMGEYEKALSCCQQALKIVEKVLGPEHPDVATTINNLARLCESMGEYEKALQLYKQALKIREKVLGPEHPDVATTLSNLAGLYGHMGEYEKALQSYNQAVKIKEKVLGPEHPDVATTLNNLAGLYRQLKDYEKALPLYQEALKIVENALGPKHPIVAKTLNNLAGLYRQLKDYEKALPLYQRDLEITEDVLGPEHPDVATTLNNLAGLYENMGEHERALPLYQKTLKIVEKTLGPEHPDVATTISNLAGLHESIGEYEKALQLYNQAYKIVEKVLGPEHPDVAATLNNLAGLYRQLKDYEKALPLYQRALQISENTFGEKNPKVAKILLNLASVYKEMGSSNENLKHLEIKEEKIVNIKKIKLKKYRNYPIKREFDLGRVNLFYGQNGSGKTSLLEAIELFMCGNNYRSRNQIVDYEIEILYEGRNEFNSLDLKNNKRYNLRDSYWYNNPYEQNEYSNNLCISFNKFNFYNTDAAFRLLNENSSGQIRKAFEDISLGENVNYVEKRLKDFLSEFRAELKRCEDYIAEYEEDINIEKDIMKEITVNKNIIGSSIPQFIEEADKIMWKGILPQSLEDSYIEFENDYNKAKMCLDYILKNTNWIPNLTLSSLKTEKNRLKKIKSQIDLIDLDIENSLEELEKIYSLLNDDCEKTKQRILEKKTLQIENKINKTYKMKDIFIGSYSKELNSDEVISTNSKQNTFQILIQNRMEKINNSIKLVEELSEIIFVSDNDPLRDIEFRLDRINNFFENLKAEKNIVNKNDIIECSYKTKIKRIEGKIKEVTERKEIVNKGHFSIKNILTSESKENYLHNFIQKNKEEIFKIFNAIHSPKEFENIDFDLDSNIILKRIKSSEYAELSTMSTGQRSALALAIFLSLNKKLQNGPPYLIFDDPISFIDDLNVLEFIDYLREIVINTDRQVFFATANENLAFLISQKFKFLGELEFKRYNLSR